jgi:hypothetical protein
MSTVIPILGGVGLFLLGMTVMRGGLKALAGSALRTVLGKAIAEPVVVPVFCQLISAQAKSGRRPIGHILSVLSNPPSTLPRPPRCGIWCWVHIHLDNL